MSIDKFGRSLRSSYKGARGPKGEGYNLTSEGDYDVQNKRLCNVGVPHKRTDATNKHYVDSKVPAYYGDRWGFEGKTLSNVGDPQSDNDAINLKTVKRFCMTDENHSWDAQNKFVTNLQTPIAPTDAATKEYVDSLCKTQNKPITTLLAKHTTDITDLCTRMAKSEGHIADNRQFHEKELRKFGMYIFNYIHRKNTGRSVTLPLGDNGDYLDWWDLFKLPESVHASEATDRIDIPMDSETREYIRNKGKL